VVPRAYRVHGRLVQGGDGCDTPQALGRWLREHRLLIGEAPVSAADLGHARVEPTFGEITDQMELARHGAHTFWGLLTRTAAVIAAHTFLRVCLIRLVEA
jgi:hypothetical protein